MTRTTATLALLLAAAALGGCSSPNPTGPPDTPPNNGFVPLETGNTWQSVVTQVTTTTYLDGTPSPPPTVLNLTAERSIIGVEEIAGQVYAVEELALSDGAQTTFAWTRYRQDAAGLYSASVPTSQPPAMPTALLIEEPADGERTRLRYPLESGTTWAVTATERATVETIETLQLPAGNVDAYRIRVESAAGGPDDFVLLWYSGCGLVRWTSHQVIRAGGPGGANLIIVRDYLEELAAITLAGDIACVLDAPPSKY